MKKFIMVVVIIFASFKCFSQEIKIYESVMWCQVDEINGEKIVGEPIFLPENGNMIFMELPNHIFIIGGLWSKVYTKKDRITDEDIGFYLTDNKGDFCEITIIEIDKTKGWYLQYKTIKKPGAIFPLRLIEKISLTY